MSQSAQPKSLCVYYSPSVELVPQLGGPPMRHLIEQCKLLGWLARNNDPRQVDVCDAMTKAGGDSRVSTLCFFNGQPTCPFYKP